MFRRLLRYALYVVAAGILASVLATVLMFPYAVDPESDRTARTRQFYLDAYADATRPAETDATGESTEGDATEELAAEPDTTAAAEPVPSHAGEEHGLYVVSARNMADYYHVPDIVSAFVRDYGLASKKVLEVGAGSGQLQDEVADYTGLDISPTARRFFHKPFVEASATDMPFPDDTFDAVWSIWTLEHIPNPELALEEMRRVVKPGGYILLYPALDVSRFASQGLHARPYEDLTWKQKFLKSLIPIADSKPFHLLYFHQIRILRSLYTWLSGEPSRLHFVRLEPNYEDYWEGDSDAPASLSNHELYLWFKTRGDTCVNCPSEAMLTFRDYPLPYLILQKTGK